MFAVVSSFFFEKKITAKDVERKIEKKHKEFAKSIVDHILQYSRNNRKKYQICGVQASDIEKSYTPFFNLHQAEEVHELVLENYIRTSQNFAELSEKLLQVYEAVKQIFEIPSDEELRRIEPTEATLKKEQMRDQQNVFNSIYPKINLRMEEGAGGELRPTINEPQLNGMEEEPRPMEAGPIERRKWSWKQTRAPSIPEELLRCISRC
ncbi:hypothetical protein B9Z55_021866 [Caenorhabditis nigoni]|uniref:Uncharacterized protein n=1 Tax=Caenorhabditis nigoni TaxID=1611254 RepID=A0A2G5TTU3_9PELO|nr:hypothetical protein B9Z55_021866 [Caenorhabditis nigoni]